MKMKQLLKFLIPLMLITVGCSLKRHVQKTDTITKSQDNTETVVTEKIERTVKDVFILKSDSAIMSVPIADGTVTVLKPFEGTTITLTQKEGEITTKVVKEAQEIPIEVKEVIERTTSTKNDITNQEVIREKDKESKTNFVWLIIAVVAVISVSIFLVYKYFSK